jgi:hypothetical protein
MFTSSVSCMTSPSIIANNNCAVTSARTPVMETVLQRYRRLGISDDIYAEQVIVTADTGFANEANMNMLHHHNINAFIPDNKFRSQVLTMRVTKLDANRLIKKVEVEKSGQSVTLEAVTINIYLLLFYQLRTN